MTLNYIKTKTDINKEERLKVISEITGTNGDYKNNRTKPRNQIEEKILDRFDKKGK